MRSTLIALVLLAACTTESRELREPGKVEQLSFIPGGDEIGYAFNTGGKGGGSTVITNTPDRYAVVFSCKHGKFILPPEGDNAKIMFNKLHVGDSVTIFYKEVYTAGHDPELIDLDFIDAVVKDTAKLQSKQVEAQ